MASATNLTAWDNALKQYYRAEAVKDLVYKSHPFLEMVSKDTRFRGKNAPVPIYYGRPQGRSATFATAQSNASASKIGEFLMTRKKNYGVVTIDGETMEAAQGDEYTFLNAVTTEIDGALKSVGDALSRNLFRTASGSIGRIAATTTLASTSIDLTDPNDVLNFEVGMKLVASSADGGGSVRAGSVTVEAVDRSKYTASSTDQITTNVNISTGITSPAANDYLFVEGDYDQGVAGLASWIPTSAPTSGDSFFGQDRSADPTRLGGNRYDGSGDTIEEALIEGAALAAREGGEPDVCFMSFSDFVSLEKALTSQVQRSVVETERFSYRSLELYAPHGIVKVVPDKDCPKGVAYMLQMDTWSLMSIGEPVRILEHDGQRMLRQSSDDGIEVRVGFYGNLACTAPGFNTRVTLP